MGSSGKYRTLDESWSLADARTVTTPGTACLMHGYTDCGICAASVARWLLGLIDGKPDVVRKAFKAGQEYADGAAQGERDDR